MECVCGHLLHHPPRGRVQPSGPGCGPSGSLTQSRPHEPLMPGGLRGRLFHDVSAGLLNRIITQLKPVHFLTLTSDLDVCSGAGFSFLFSWLFMIVVLLLFLLGGNTYTLICQPWNNGQLLKVVTDTVSCKKKFMKYIIKTFTVAPSARKSDLTKISKTV